MKAHGKDVKPLDKEAMLEYVQKSGGKVIAKKGATFYAVSATVCQLVGLILAASDSLATVSSMLHGEYGIEDVCYEYPYSCRTKWNTGKSSLRCV